MQTAERTTKLAEINKSVGKEIKKTNEIVIKNSEDLIKATDFLAKLVNWKKRIEQIRLSYTKPLNEALKNINSDFKKAVAPLLEAEKTVKNLMVQYRQIEAEKIAEQRRKDEERQRKEYEKQMEKERKLAEKEAEKERKRLEKEKMNKKERADRLKAIEDERKAKEEAIDQSKEEFIPESNIKQDNTVHSESGAIRARKAWKFEVLNEEKLPREFMKVDEVKIRQAVRDGVREIDGVRIYEEEIIGSY